MFTKFPLLIPDTIILAVFYFKQKTAYEMRISDWSSDVCSSDLYPRRRRRGKHRLATGGMALPSGAHRTTYLVPAKRRPLSDIVNAQFGFAAGACSARRTP